jgi:uncharacterized protein YjbI with pentapeptide repeats
MINKRFQFALVLLTAAASSAGADIYRGVARAARRCAYLAVVITAALATTTQADIFRWDNGQLIPGTAGITPGPSAQLELDHRELKFANLEGLDLTGASLESSDLTGSTLRGAIVSNANFKDAVIAGTLLFAVHGFTQDQLRSTASYQTKNLRGITFAGDRTGWDLDSSGQDLTNAKFFYCYFNGFDISCESSVLREANLSATILVNAYMRNSDLTGANLQGANLVNADLTSSVLRGANLQRANLVNTNLQGSDLTGANFDGGDYE